MLINVRFIYLLPSYMTTIIAFKTTSIHKYNKKLLRSYMTTIIAFNQMTVGLGELWNF